MIICIVVMIFGTTGLIYEKITNKDGEKVISSFGAMGAALLFSSTGICISLLLICLFLNLPRSKAKLYNELSQQRAALVTRLETYNQIDDTILFSEIAEFNTRIQNEKYDLNSPWVNWYTSPVYNEIEIINYEDYLRTPVQIEVETK